MFFHHTNYGINLERVTNMIGGLNESKTNWGHWT